MNKKYFGQHIGSAPDPNTLLGRMTQKAADAIAKSKAARAAAKDSEATEAPKKTDTTTPEKPAVPQAPDAVKKAPKPAARNSTDLAGKVAALKRGGASKEEVAQQLRSSTVTAGNDGEEASSDFSEQPLDYLLATLFGTPESEKVCEGIFKEAEEITDPKEKQEFIEGQVRDYAKEKEKGFSKMGEDFFKEGGGVEAAQKAFRAQEEPRKPLEIDSSKGLEHVRSLGFNVDPDNFKQYYSEGPNGNPKVFTTVMVIKSSENFQHPDCPARKLAGAFGNSLEAQGLNQEAKEFNDKIAGHAQHSANGGPTIPKEQFAAQAMGIAEQKSQEAIEKVAAKNKGPVVAEEEGKEKAPNPMLAALEEAKMAGITPPGKMEAIPDGDTLGNQNSALQGKPKAVGGLAV